VRLWIQEGLEGVVSLLGSEERVLRLEGAIEEFEGEVSGVSFVAEDGEVIADGNGAVTGQGAVGVVLLTLRDIGGGVVDVDVGDSFERESFKVVEGGAAVPEVEEVDDEAGGVRGRRFDGGAGAGAVEHGLGVFEILDRGVVTDEFEGGGAPFFAADVEEVLVSVV
jgi:hypothetical protein